MNVTQADYDAVARNAATGRLNDWDRVSDNLWKTAAAARAEGRRVKTAVKRRNGIKLEARLVETLSSVLSENHDTYVVEVRAAEKQVPADYPVQPLANLKDATDPVTCGTCGRSWDDAIATGMTPAPAARCPFETFH